MSSEIYSTVFSPSPTHRDSSSVPDLGPPNDSPPPPADTAAVVDLELAAAIALSQQESKRPSPAHLFATTVNAGLLRKWATCEGSLNALLEHPLLPLEQLYLLTERSFLEIKLGKYEEALASISKARAVEEKSIHAPYLSLLEAQAYYFLGNYRRAMQKIEDAPLSLSPRINSALLEIKTLSYLKEGLFSQAEQALTHALSIIREEQQAPRFVQPEKLSTNASHTVYLEMVLEEKRAIEQRLEQTQMLFSLLSGKFNETDSFFIRPEQADCIASEGDLQNALLTIYSLLLRNNLRDAAQLLLKLPNLPDIFIHTRSTHTYLHAFLTMRLNPSVLQNLGVIPFEHPLLIPITDNEQLFCLGLSLKAKEQFSDALAHFDKLLRRSSLSQAAIERLRLQCFELSFKTRNLAKAEELAALAPLGKGRVDLRIDLYKIKLYLLQRKTEDVLILIEKILTSQTAPPLVCAYLLSEKARLLLNESPQQAQQLVVEARQQLSNSSPSSAQVTPSPLRIEELFLSDFERKPISALPPEIKRETVERKLDECQALSSKALTQTPFLSAHLSPTTQAFIFMKEHRWDKALDLLNSALTTSNETDRKSVQHMLAFVHFMRSENTQAKEYLHQVLTAEPQILSSNEHRFCSIILSLLEGNLKQAKVQIAEITVNPIDTQSEKFRLLQLIHVHLQLIFSSTIEFDHTVLEVHQGLQLDPYRLFLIGESHRFKNIPNLAIDWYRHAAALAAPPLRKMILKRIAICSFDRREFVDAAKAARSSLAITVEPQRSGKISSVTPDSLFLDNAVSSPVFLTLLDEIADEFIERIVLTKANVPISRTYVPPPDGFGSHRAFIAATSALFARCPEIATHSIDTNFTFLYPEAMTGDKQFDAREQRLLLIRAFLYRLTGQSREEDKLIHRAFSSPMKICDKVDEEEKIFCGALYALQTRHFELAKGYIEDLIKDSTLPPERLAYLLAEKAYLQNRMNTSREQVEATLREALGSSPSQNTVAYCQYVRGKILIENGEYAEAKSHFTHALTATTPSNHLRFLMIRECLRLSVKMKDRAYAIQNIKGILDLYSSIKKPLNTFIPALDPYLQNAGSSRHFFAIEELSQEDFFASAGLEICAAYLFFREYTLAIKNAKHTLQNSRPSPNLHASLLIRETVGYLRTRQWSLAALSAQSALRQNPPNALIQRECLYYSVFASFCETGQVELQDLETMEKLIAPSDPFFLDVAFLKLETAHDRDASIQIDALLEKDTIPPRFRSYLKAVQGNLYKIDYARPKIKDADNELKKEDPLRYYIRLISMKLERKQGNLDTAVEIARIDDNLQNAPPLLKANFYLERSKVFFSNSQCAEAIAQAKSGLATLEEKDPLIELPPTNHSFFVSYREQMGTLPPCISQRLNLADALHHVACCSYEQISSYTHLFAQAQQALKIDNLPPSRQAFYLLLSSRAKSLLKEKHEAFQLAKQAQQIDHTDELLKKEIGEWISTLDSELDQDWLIE